MTSRRRRQQVSASPEATRDVAARPPVSWWKKLVFSLVVCAFFFGVAELILWAAGMPTQIEREDPFRGFSGLLSVFQKDGDVYRTRRALAGGVFNDQAFLADKPTNGLRLFCLGGSSSYGYPWGAEAAFTCIVGEALGEGHPDRHVEAVNASGVSYAMHRMNIVADELLAYKPDVFLVYEGHNEFIEPAMFDELKHRGAGRVRLEYVLANSRTYSGMRALIERVKGGDAPSSRTLDADVRRDQTRTFSPKEKEAVVAEFRWRLERLVGRARRGGVKVLLSTVPCNLRQWRPESSILEGISERDRRDWAEAFATGKKGLASKNFAGGVEGLERAVRLAPGHAETQFLLGQAYEGLGRWDEAREAYKRACDADAKPSRRLSAVNEAIRSVASQTGVLLVDADRIFEEHSEHGLVGFNLIEDYVHPTREGHELIALHVWKAIEQAGWAGGKGQPQQANFDSVVVRRHKRAAPQNAAWLRNQAVVLQNQGRAEAAMDKYRQCLAIEADDPVSLMNLGTMLHEAGRNQEAVSFLERLAARNDKHFVALNNLGSALTQLGRTKDAIRRYEEALAIQPNYAQGHANLGSALAQIGDLPKALSHCQQALRIEPNSALSHNMYALVLVQAGRIPEAIEHYEEALRTRADSPEVHFNLAQALMRAGKSQEAIDHFEQALGLQPNHPGIHLNLGLALMTAGKVPEAIGHFEQAVRIKPDMAEAHMALAQALQQTGKIPEAIEAFREAFRCNPQLGQAGNRAGALLNQQGRVGEAVDILEQVLKSNPQDVEARFNIGHCLSQQGRPGEALVRWREALQLRPDHIILLNDMAWALATNPDDSVRNGKEAVELVSRGVQQSGGKMPELLDTQAAAYAEAGRFSEAIQTAEKALSLIAPSHPQAGDIRRRLALYKAGRPFRDTPPAATTKP